ncbi:MAG: ATP synthase F1 subunit delta [Candidatus Latescibacterota bacterium]|mgnify:CR=1 FL=1|jgi:F-type H+-transporting ATPase subunit delta|tara:strand:- start:484 stop:1023 length:540 start_codon:yes stop_codon:yes gene_type:complete
MNAPEVVRRYAATLLNAAEETGVLESVRSDVEGVLETMAKSKDLVGFLENPLFSADIQHKALVAIFEGKLQELTLNFLSLMAQRRRTNLLSQALETFLVLAEEKEGVVSAEVVSAVALTEDQQERLRGRLATYTGKKVRLQSHVDPNLRGGVVAKVGDTVFDGSINTHLERLRRHLGGA